MVTDLSTLPLPIGLENITRCISHRFPFLFVEKILDYKPDESLHAIKCVSASEPILQGHFPENPHLPKVLVLEGLAQASGILGSLSQGKEYENHLLLEINNAQFIKQVVPGDVIHYHIQYTKRRKGFVWFEGVAKVDGHDVVTAEFSAKMT